MPRIRPQTPPYRYKSLEREILEAALMFLAVAAVAVLAVWRYMG